MMNEDRLYKTMGASLGYILANAKDEDEAHEMIETLRNYLKEKQEEIKNEQK